MIRLNKETELTPKIIKILIDDFINTKMPRYKKLYDYYTGKHAILNRLMADPAKPNNKIVHPYANYITDSFVGYFIGEPISYSAADPSIIDQLNLTFVYNDEQDHNSEIAKDASIYGVAYEMLYVDSNGITRFKKTSPIETIVIYDDTVENEMLAAIRFYQNADIETKTVKSFVEVYTANSILSYKGNDNYTDLALTNELPHYFGIVPFVEYKNNDDMIGDFELVISLIDAYDKLNSDNLNDFEAFVDAYLGLYGMDADAEDIALMKENRVLLMPTDSKAEWIIKNVNDAQIENLKTRLSEDIHKFSKCPSLTDKDFAANASGVSMRYKLMGMENVAATKERKFKRGIQRRIEAISNIMQLNNSANFDWRSISITFKRNLPANIVELSDTINKLRGLVSNETLLGQLPFIEDVASEQERISNENAAAQPEIDLFKQEA